MVLIAQMLQLFLKIQQHFGKQVSNGLDSTNVTIAF